MAERSQRIAQFVRQSGQELVFAAVRFLQCVGVSLEFVTLDGDLLPLTVEVEKYIRFAAQNVGFDRFVDEVDRAGLIATKAALAVGTTRRHEYYRNPPGAFVTAHQLGQLEAVQSGHLHVDERQRDVVSKQKFEGFVARARLQQHQPVAAKQCFQRQEIFLQIVD